MNSREEAKDQESFTIQSSTIPDPEHHMGKGQNTRRHNIQERQEVSPFPAGDHKAARNRQDSITTINKKHKYQKGSKKKHLIGTVDKNHESRTLVLLWTKTYKCMVRMKDPLLINVSSPSI